MAGLALSDPIASRQWHASFPAPVTAMKVDVSGVSLVRFRGTGAQMEQPALTEHVLCLHLGGDKRVRRLQGERIDDFDVADHALTIMPAGQANSWVTQGPVDYVHLTLEPALLDQLALEEFAHPPGAWELHAAVGLRDAEIAWMLLELLRLGERRHSGGRLYPESLVTVIAATLVGRHIGVKSAIEPLSRARGGLAEWRRRRVVDFMTANLAADLSLAALVEVSGLSRAQFFRAFYQSTGFSPHKYLSMLRMEQAGALIRDTRLSLSDITAAVGLKNGPRFAIAFRRRFGIAPQNYSR